MTVLWDYTVTASTPGSWPDRGAIERVSADRMRPVTSPVVSGQTHSMRFEVRQGDDPINASGYRCEVSDGGSAGDHCRPGDIRWYSFSTYFETIPTLASGRKWNIFAQWHQTEAGGGSSPPLEFVWEHGGTLAFYQRLKGGSENVLWRAAGTLGVWHHFIFNVCWSASASQGYVAIWHNGVNVLPRKSCVTFFSGDTYHYLKYGLYRGEDIVPTAVVYHGRWCIATAQADVFGNNIPPDTNPGPQPTDPGTPTPNPPPDFPTPPVPPAPPPDPAPPILIPPVEEPRPPPAPDDPTPGGVGIRYDIPTPRSRRRLRLGSGL